MALKISITEKQAGVFIVSPDGPLDSDTYGIFESRVAEILKPSTKTIILNMEGVTFITSMGMSVILGTRKALEDIGGVFVMTGLQPQIKKVFDIANVLRSMNVFANMAEADRYFLKIEQKEIEKQRSKKS